MSKVLIVDDEVAYREQLSEIFSRDGYEVETAANGKGAVEIGERFHPDLLVVDWMLQNDLDGFDVVNSLRGSAPQVKTVLITGYPTSTLEARARGARIGAVLYKPFDHDDLRSAVTRAVLD